MIARKPCADCGELFVPLKECFTQCFDCRIKAQKAWREERERTIEEHEKKRVKIPARAVTKSGNPALK